MGVREIIYLSKIQVLYTCIHPCYEALSRIINIPTRGVGATSLRKIEAKAIEYDMSLWETIEDIVNNPENYKPLRLSTKVKSALSMFHQLISDARLLESSKEPPSEIYNRLLHESGMMDALKSSKDYESLARIENLEELYNAIKSFEETTDNPSLLGYLETVTLDDSHGQEAHKFGEVSLMTIHGSKGLEFPFVFVTTFFPFKVNSSFSSKTTSSKSFISFPS